MSRKHKPISAIVQARLTSTRFPGKVLRKVGDKTIVDHIIARLQRCRHIDQIIFAIPNTPENDPLANYLLTRPVKIYRGEENDVMGRMVGAAHQFKIRDFARICADSPFILPWAIDYAIDLYRLNDYDYFFSRGLVTGQNVELVHTASLSLAHDQANIEQREHVTLYFEENYQLFNVGMIDIKNLCVDTPDDLGELGPIAQYYD